MYRKTALSLLAADGVFGYTLDNGSAAVQSLGCAGQVTERFDFTVVDGIAAVAAPLPDRAGNDRIMSGGGNVIVARIPIGGKAANDPMPLAA